MKFYYAIKPELEEEIILKLPSPYVLEEFARSLMQQFVAGQPKMKAIPDGVYLIDLYRETMPIDEKIGVTNSFVKNADTIRFIETNYDQD